MTAQFPQTSCARWLTGDNACSICEELDLVTARLAAEKAYSARLRQEVAEYEQLTGKLGRLLTETANALKGDPGPLKMHDWSDLPMVAREMARRDASIKAVAKGPQ